MAKNELSGKLTNAQLELLKVFSLNLTQKEMKKLKDVITKFVDEITQEQLDKCIEKGNYTLGKTLSNEHLRTPYNK